VTTPTPMPSSTPARPAAPISPMRKAAILLVQLGKEQASKVLAKLPEQMVEDLTAEIVRLRDVSWADAESVVGEAYKSLVSSEVAGRGGLELAKQLLANSVGAERAEEIMERLGATLAEMPFEGLRRADARQLVTFLADEHPQTIALVLAHLGPAQSAIVLSGLERGRQADVAQRIALMEQASPDVIRLVERELDRRMSTVMTPQELSAVGGVPPLVAIINRADRSTERMILEGLEAESPELAEQVRAQMFVFEDVVTLDDAAVQLVLRNVESGDLALALKGTSTIVREKIMRNLSTRAAENLSEEIELLGPRRLSEVEEAQAKVVNEIRALEQAGKIVIMRGSDDALVD
jgi:flagellar motor switch protein FliG